MELEFHSTSSGMLFDTDLMTFKIMKHSNDVHRQIARFVLAETRNQLMVAVVCTLYGQ